MVVSQQFSLTKKGIVSRFRSFSHVHFKIASFLSLTLLRASYRLSGNDSCEFRVASFELRVVSCELRVVSCEFRVSSCELRVARR